MSNRSYMNIGASVTPDSKKFVEMIFAAIGYAPNPESGSEFDYNFYNEPDIVYSLVRLEEDDDSEEVEDFEQIAFDRFNEIDILNLLNALFPGTSLEIYYACDSDDYGEIFYDYEEKKFDVKTMTYMEHSDRYSSDVGERSTESWKERFKLEAPDMEFVLALLDASTQKGFAELTALLTNLVQKTKDGLIVYEDDSSDTREVGERYDCEYICHYDDDAADDDDEDDEEDDEDEEY